LNVDKFEIIGEGIVVSFTGIVNNVNQDTYYMDIRDITYKETSN